MKMSDKELEELIYSLLRRTPHTVDDLTLAKRIVDAIIEAEIAEISDLKVE